ncbi:hypothetical protein [Streptomyces sp. NPDC058092]|uniref:hypothetical protein n=1 Tax=Streptomyces sp. NPDC058092 TaxID=3346336 RepID=UPI0036EE288E
MTGFLAVIGTKLADRWVQALVLPGLLWVATLAVVARLGQDHPLDVDRLTTWLDRLATQPTGRSSAGVLLMTTAVLLGSSTAGLAAGALGGLLQRLWGASGAHPPLAWAVRWRRRRHITERARRAIARAADPHMRGGSLARALVRAVAARHEHRRMALIRGGRMPEAPTRPTWIGNRFHNAATRVHTLYDLDLELAWPRLWAVLPDNLRGDVTGARDSYTAAARLTAWGLLYGALATGWWPAAPIGACLVVAGVVRARSSAEVLAGLIETAVDLHVNDLAHRLGTPAGAPPTVETGRAITSRLQGPL